MKTWYMTVPVPLCLPEGATSTSPNPSVIESNGDIGKSLFQFFITVTAGPCAHSYTESQHILKTETKSFDLGKFK